MRNRLGNNTSQDELLSPKRKKIVETRPTPRREGLRPRRSTTVARNEIDGEAEDDDEDEEDDEDIEEEQDGRRRYDLRNRAEVRSLSAEEGKAKATISSTSCLQQGIGTKVDETVSFDDIGGLSEYIDALKEMVFFPLLYPDFFESYHITPPRGVLLCGPPGTGKTLIARALACAASKAGQKVSFYMRKGADV
ncbi:ATPase family AAA domain-containing protein [Tripterygium wilfordii]|uniref:ATPase family AAA domain-containing protein n=1 Tax=Tripterygium wilfordii TaxID=458696 RepID=A0A7J7CIL4_TRIWF|nr:ATPase family AAA domain-containing protein [Tripterygium wilfordii]